MADTPTTAEKLDTTLGLAYQAMALGKRPIADAESAFAAGINGDDAFLPAAKDKLAYLSNINPNKCFISKTNADFLARMTSNQEG